MRHLLVSVSLAFFALPVLAQVEPDLAQDSRVADGRDMFMNGDEAGGLALLVPEAEAGHPRAQNILGAAYQYGRGVPVDAALAQDWLGRAAAQNFPAAIHNLGVLFEVGMVGLDPDLTRARAYYRQAAVLDYPPSLGQYGLFAYEGTGGPVDRVAAQRAFSRGAEMGDRLSAEWWAYHLEVGEQTAIDLAQARHYYSVAAGQGSTYAAAQLGEMLEFGEGGPTDLHGAYSSYAAAVLGDEAWAGINMAYLHLENPDVFPDQSRGYAYCRWAVAHAPAEELEGWQQTCDDILTDLTPSQASLGEKRAEALLRSD